MLMASPTTERNGNPVRSLNEFIHLL